RGRTWAMVHHWTGEHWTTVYPDRRAHQNGDGAYRRRRWYELRRMCHLRFSLWVALAACAATVPKPAPLPPLPGGVRAVACSATRRVWCDDWRRALGEPFEQYLRTDDAAEGERLEAAIAARFAALGFAWGKVSAITYFHDKPETYVTLDVVEPEDRARRMPFG